MTQAEPRLPEDVLILGNLCVIAGIQAVSRSFSSQAIKRQRLVTYAWLFLFDGVEYLFGGFSEGLPEQASP